MTSHLRSVTLIYQTGYLTIKSYDADANEFKVGIPNREVDRSLFHYLLGEYSVTRDTGDIRKLVEISSCLKVGEPKEALERLQSLLGGISYHLQGKMTEIDFERTLFVIFHVLGFHVHCELATSWGRIDLLVDTKDYIYVIELKYDGSPEEALRQIEEKDYALQWKFDGRKIYKIGINFSSEKRNIDAWIIDF